MTTSKNIKKAKKALSMHYVKMADIHMSQLFKTNPKRTEQFSLETMGLFFDFSKNIICDRTIKLLFKFAKDNKISNRINEMFAGKKINLTENTAALHTALRAPKNNKIIYDGINIVKDVHFELNKLEKFVCSVHSGELTGWTKKPFDTFVNIGIGGSCVGAKLVIESLGEYQIKNKKTFFISNIDEQQIIKLKKNINPETTLFIISSKSFNTTETKINAENLIAWMKKNGCDEINKHFIAVTAAPKAAMKYGVSKNNIFSYWNWVGGRFSLWSANGIPIALTLGFNNFKKLLKGGRQMDVYFRKTKIENNIVIILALLDFWYINFFNAQTQAFIPYDQRLSFLPEYLAQLFMESNGKSSNLDGDFINYKTAPVVWGGVGTDAQHSFFQLLHQGTSFIPVEFLAPIKTKGDKKHHDLLLANCIAQSQALMTGKKNTAPNYNCTGNKPNTIILYKKLNPKTLGKLLAFYEHRSFVQGLLWNINSFDQLGVELGKKIASNIYEQLQNKKIDCKQDSSTKKILELYKKHNY